MGGSRNRRPWGVHGGCKEIVGLAIKDSIRQRGKQQCEDKRLPETVLSHASATSNWSETEFHMRPQ